MQLIRVTAADVLILTTTGVAALNDFSDCNKKLLRRNFPETIDDNVKAFVLLGASSIRRPRRRVLNKELK